MPGASAALSRFANYGGPAGPASATAPSGAGVTKRAYPTPPPGPAPDTGLTDFINTTRGEGLSGSYTSPSGATYYAGGAGGSGGGGSRSGGSASAAAPAPSPYSGSDTFDSDMARVATYLPKAPAPVNPAALPDSSAADAVTFARAKDRAGLQARSALDSLHEALASSGLSGSTIEGRGTANVVNNAVNEIGEVSRDAALHDAGRTDAVADRNYAGALTQRGQDMGFANDTVAHRSALMSLLERSRRANSSYLY